MTAHILKIQSPHLKAHPLAELFPTMTGAAFDALVDHIRQHGQQEPILVVNDLIIDGRSRARACRVLNIEPRVEQWTGSADETTAFIIAHQSRHLRGPGQRAMIAAKLQNVTSSKAAEMLKVGRATVVDARCVLRYGTAEEIAGVMDGRMAVSGVADAIRRGRAAQPGPAPRKLPTTERGTRLTLYAGIWQQLDAALHALTNLPSAAEVARIVRHHPKRKARTDATLARALNWLEDFTRAYTDPDAEEGQQPPS